MLPPVTTLAVNFWYHTNSSRGIPTPVDGVFITLIVIFYIIMVIGLWKVFVKAGRPGWAAIIPLYNTWVLAEIAGKPGWYGLYPLLGWIPFVGFLIAAVAGIIIALSLAKKFGKDQLFAIFGLWLFSTIGYLMLGFGSAQYSRLRETEDDVV